MRELLEVVWLVVEFILVTLGLGVLVSAVFEKFQRKSTDSNIWPRPTEGGKGG